MRGFHVTTFEAYGSIREQGLLPRIGPRSTELGEENPQIYFFRSREDVEQGLMQWLGDEFNEDEVLLVLEVDLSAIDVVATEGQFELTVSQPIGPDRILRCYDENLSPISLARVRP